MKLTCNKSAWLDDWYLIKRAEHDDREWIESRGQNWAALMSSARFSDADVEGTASEMLAIADAIERRGAVSFKRCAVDARSDTVTFRSPRNSQRSGECSLAEALELAAVIRRDVKPETEEETNDD